MKDKFISYTDSLLIEVTRRCNLKCQLCLRGPAQRVDLDLKYVDTLFKHIGSIGMLTITGGEPALVPGIIKNIVYLAKKHKVSIGSFFIATNGKKQEIEFVEVIIMLHAYCDDNEMSQIRISREKYHRWAFPDYKAGMLEMLKIVNVEEDDYDNYVRQGRAESYNFGDPTYTISEHNWRCARDYDHLDEVYRIDESELYLNALGQIIRQCDYSYANQKHNIIADINKSDWSERLLSYIKNNLVEEN